MLLTRVLLGSLDVGATSASFVSSGLAYLFRFYQGGYLEEGNSLSYLLPPTCCTRTEAHELHRSV